MYRYLPIVKRYGWIVGAVVLLAALIGAVVVHAMPPENIVSSTLVVQVPSSAVSTGTLLGNPTTSITQADVYAAEVVSRDAMTFVVHQYPELTKHGYSVYNLMHDVTATPGTTAATISIQATGRTSTDAIMMANDVAQGFVVYAAQQAQAQVNTLRDDLNKQLQQFEAQRNALETKFENTQFNNSQTTTTTTRNSSSSNGSNSFGATSTNGSAFGNTTTTTTTNTDPRYAVYQTDLASLNTTIGTLQTQIATLPTNAPPTMSIIQLATPVDVSPSAKPLLIVAALLLVGLILGLVIAGLMIYFDRRLYGAEMVKPRLGQAYLGGLSTDAALATTPAHPSLQAAQESANIYAGLRLMGFAQMIHPDRRGNVLLVTSAQEAAGKTTLACALAGAAARAGSSVILVDGNLRHPADHVSLHVEPTGVGLSGLLAGEGSVDEAIHETDVPNLTLLPAGPAVEVPTLLLQDHFPDVLHQVCQMADVIVVDGPGMLSSADGVLLANMADQAVLVVDARHDQMPQLERAVELMTTLTSTPIGVVLNRIPNASSQGYFATALRHSALPERRVPVLAGTKDAFVPLEIGPAPTSANGGGEVSNGHLVLPEANTNGRPS